MAGWTQAEAHLFGTSILITLDKSKYIVAKYIKDKAICSQKIYTRLQKKKKKKKKLQKKKKKTLAAKPITRLAYNAVSKGASRRQRYSEAWLYWWTVYIHYRYHPHYWVCNIYSSWTLLPQIITKTIITSFQMVNKLSLCPPPPHCIMKLLSVSFLCIHYSFSPECLLHTLG